MRGIIVSSGNLDIKILNNIKLDSDMIICADGGTRHLYNANITPDIIVGDFDSLDHKILDYYEEKKVPIYKFPTDKDKTDTEIAIDFALEKGIDEIILLGATGCRLDHTMGNIMILYRLLKENIKAKIIDSNNEICVVDDTLELEKENYTYASIMPMFGDIKEVTLKGFKYETDKIEFKLGTSLGVSNEIEDRKGKINVNGGTCLVIKSRD
ncbi:MAG: thiamine diphosphokinase [Tissierellia bacterium]|nr:thiamine diphosphokinase [Tissierellia bacterium]